MNLPTNPSSTFARLNPHLYGQQPAPAEPKPGKRIRQDPKPLMNKLEQEWFDIISREFPIFPRPRAQAKRYRLGNGIWYKPDFTSSAWPNRSGNVKETAWEVKGPRAFRGGFENLKVAASTYPEVRWILVWKDKSDGQWRQQEVLP